MSSTLHRHAVLALLLIALSAVSGCVFWPPTSPAPEEGLTRQAPDPAAPRLPALDTRDLKLDPSQAMVGELQVLFARFENTLPAIAREYDVGFEELRQANPAVDVWLPGEGTAVYLPTQHVLPDGAREGIVLNVAAMRLYYFRPDKTASATRVTTYPIGIGREGWATPTGSGTVTQKARDPVWYVPASVRKEHAELGDPLPNVVPAGPDNPLGRFALALSLPGYLIHGTNMPSGVGMRVSHGCVRLYPEDIEALFAHVPVGTPVEIVNEPVLAAWHEGELYLEVHRPLSEDTRELGPLAEQVIARRLAEGESDRERIDEEAVQSAVSEQRGIPVPILKPTHAAGPAVAPARIVVNTVPLPPRTESASLAP